MSRIHTYCKTCNQPLLVKYDLNKAGASLTPKSFKNRVNSLWRYRELLPLQNEKNKVTLEEGFTPLYYLKRLGSCYELPAVWVKEEGLNPTGSFKARGQTLAISNAKELGVQECIVPSAGNAGGAMSAYCAAAGIKEISSTEGITISPEGAAVWKAMMQLVNREEMNRGSKVLLLNTGSGYKYFENYPVN